VWRSILQAEVWEKLKRFGRSRGLSPENAEDYASEAFICLFRGRKATFDQLLIDFKRKEYGDTRAKSFRVRHAEDVTELERVGGLNHVSLGAQSCSDENRGNNLANDFYISGRAGLIWDLVNDCGFKSLEVADMFGVKESRICQILKEVKASFEAHVLRKDLIEKLEDDPEYLELKVDWITI
jgi:hypothetical protein